MTVLLPLNVFLFKHAGVSISVGSTTVFLTEGETDEICVIVSSDQKTHERGIPILLAAVTSSNTTSTSEFIRCFMNCNNYPPLHWSLMPKW